MMWTTVATTYDESFRLQLVVKIILKNNQFLNNNFQFLLCTEMSGIALQGQVSYSSDLRT